MISITLKICNTANLAYRQAAKVLETLWGYLGVSKTWKLSKPPHYSTIRLWVLRNAFAQLNAPVEPADEWALLGDATCAVGVTQCFMVLGINMKDWKTREDRTLSHSDVRVFEVCPTSRSTGDTTCGAFEEATRRVKGQVVMLLSDQGTDVKRGGKLYTKMHPEVCHVFDIPHKLSGLLEKDLGKNEIFLEFAKKLNHTRRLVAQTELAALMPPSQRGKGRFMNVALYLNWPLKIQEAKRENRLVDISEERFQKYFGWIDKYMPFIELWKQKVDVTETIKDIVRKKGLSQQVFKELEQLLSERQSADFEVQQFRNLALKCIEEESNKLNAGQIVPGSTEVLESIFGKFKYLIGQGVKEITGNSLRLVGLAGPHPSVSETKRFLEQCSTMDLKAWISNKVGPSLQSLRRRYFKRTKFADEMESAIIA